MTESTNERDKPPTQTSLASSVFAGVGIGLMVGLMLGLANPAGDGKSTVAIFVGAVGAALAVLLGLNDRHFSVAKAMRIGSFGLAAVIATPTGIAIRAHDLLAPPTPPVPSLAEKKKELEDLGYKEPQLLALLQQFIGQPGEIRETVAMRVSSRSGLHATETSDDVCGILKDDSDWKTPEFESVELINFWSNKFTSNESLKWQPLLEAVYASPMPEKSKKNLLFIARDAGCGFNKFEGQTFQPTDEQCQAFADSGQAIDSILNPDELTLVRERIEGEHGLALEHRDFAYSVIGEFICR